MLAVFVICLELEKITPIRTTRNDFLLPTMSRIEWDVGARLAGLSTQSRLLVRQRM